jgi:hypothetical protein
MIATEPYFTIALTESSFVLVVAGDGPDKHLVVDAAERYSCLIFVGSVDRSAAPALLAEAFEKVKVLSVF